MSTCLFFFVLLLSNGYPPEGKRFLTCPGGVSDQGVDKEERQVLGTLEFLVSIRMKNELLTSSEVGWIDTEKLILTLDDSLYEINLTIKDWVLVHDTIEYSMQQVDMDTFCMIIRLKKSSQLSAI